MYQQLVEVAADALANVGSAYDESGRSPDLGFYYLLLHEATLTSFRDEAPPEGGEALHTALLAWVEAGRDLLLGRLQGNPDTTEDPYNNAAVVFLQELARAADAEAGAVAGVLE
jgi:hypothetical protein